MSTITTEDGITVRLGAGKYEARTAPTEDTPTGHWLADGRTAQAALAKARDNLSGAGTKHPSVRPVAQKTEPLTNAMIRALRDEAGNASDRVTVRECDAALDGVDECRWAVAKAINDARALDDSRPFVRVVAD